MEKTINRKIAQYSNQFKETVTDEIKILNIDDTQKADLLRLIYDYNVLVITKADITKRKRDPHDFCGTHIKGTPHGVITDKPPKKTHKEIDVWLCEIHGISYYIDADNNVYSH